MERGDPYTRPLGGVATLPGGAGEPLQRREGIPRTSGAFPAAALGLDSSEAAAGLETGASRRAETLTRP